MKSPRAAVSKMVYGTYNCVGKGRDERSTLARLRGDIFPWRSAEDWAALHYVEAVDEIRFEQKCRMLV